MVVKRQSEICHADITRNRKSSKFDAVVEANFDGRFQVEVLESPSN